MKFIQQISKANKSGSVIIHGLWITKFIQCVLANKYELGSGHITVMSLKMYLKKGQDRKHVIYEEL